MATVRELITRWGFEVDDKPLKNLEKTITSVKRTVLAVGAAAVAAAGSLFGLAQSTAAAGDDIAKTAGLIGISIEALQEYRFAADLAGVSNSEVDNSFLFLSRSMSEASRGTGAAKDVFEELGIVLTDSSDKLRKTEDVFLDVSDALKNLDSAADKTGFAMKILGRGGRRLVNLFNQGRTAIMAQREELRKYGLITEEQARAAEAFVDAQARITAVFVGIKNTIGSRLIPSFIILTDKFREFILQNREFIKQKLGKVFKALFASLKTLAAFVKTTSVIFKQFIIRIGGAEKAISFLTKAFTVFLGLKLLSFIGTATSAFFGLISAIRKVGIMATLTNLKIIALPLAIGAAVVAAGLLIDDFFGFLEGKRSLFGKVLEKFGVDPDKARTGIKSFFSGVGDFVGDVVSDIISDIKTAIEIIVPLAKWAAGKVSDFFSGVGDFVGDVVSDIISDIKNIPESISKGLANIGAYLGLVTPAQAGLTGIMPQTPFGVPVTNALPINIGGVTINVPTETPVEKLVPAMEAGFKAMAGEIAREMKRQGQPAVKY